MKPKSALILLIILIISLTFSLWWVWDNLIIAKEISSPGDWVRQDQIKVYENQVVIDLPDSEWLYFTDTNSMDPFIDENTNALQIKPKSPDSIAIGDIITYKNQSELIIHRVIEKNQDEDGLYYVVKGDNNSTADPVKVRFEDIEGVVVAVIY